MSALTDADELALEALVRLQLTARRLGRTVRLRHASAQLVDLLALVGLTDVLAVACDAANAADAPDTDAPDAESSGVEVDGQVEQREEVGVDEVVDGGDAAV